ncbi:MAG: hypothetical protein AAGA28_17140 [Pseudomonadota bacterium]
MKDEPHVILHGGFHKTATSHIQSTLNRNAGFLRKRGVVYVPHRLTRKEFTVPCQLYVYNQSGMNYRTKYNEEELREKTKAFFSGAVSPEDRPERVIISEENLAGHCGHCVKRGLLYLWREPFLETVAREIPWRVTEVHLGLRNYADFFASAFVEYLRSLKNADIVDIRTMRKNVTAHMPSWVKVLRCVRSHFPDAKLFVWPYEDYRAVEGIVLDNLCGSSVDASDLAKPKENNKRPSASDRAVREMLELAHRFGVEHASAQRVTIQERFPKGEHFPAFDPWTHAERRHLIRLYERDLADIRADAGLTLIEAHTTVPRVPAI